MRKKSLIFALFFIVFDQLIKLFVDNVFSYGEKLVIIPSFFSITKIHNFGAAWSLFAGGRYLLIIIAIASFLILYIYEKSFLYRERTLFGFSLIYGGLIGNLLDRILNGYVIDYLSFKFGYYYFPVFNLADMCIVIGFLLIMYAIIKGEDRYANKLRRKRY